MIRALTTPLFAIVAFFIQPSLSRDDSSHCLSEIMPYVPPKNTKINHMIHRLPNNEKILFLEFAEKIQNIATHATAKNSAEILPISEKTLLAIFNVEKKDRSIFIDTLERKKQPHFTADECLHMAYSLTKIPTHHYDELFKCQELFCRKDTTGYHLSFFWDALSYAQTAEDLPNIAANFFRCIAYPSPPKNIKNAKSLSFELQTHLLRILARKNKNDRDFFVESIQPIIVELSDIDQKLWTIIELNRYEGDLKQKVAHLQAFYQSPNNKTPQDYRNNLIRHKFS